MKYNFSTTSNPRLNVPMTQNQWDVVDFVAFESETSIVYPFAIKFDDLTFEMIDKIVKYCNNNTSNTDFLYEGCEEVLGINPDLLK